MRTAKLTHDDRGDGGIFGTLITDLGFTCRTVENAALAIGSGTFTCLWLPSPAHGMCYHLQNVLGRTFIEIHSANWAYQLLGCIAPGATVEMVQGKKGVTLSVATLAALVANLGQQTFELTIV
jgi:hypothetical protein